MHTDNLRKLALETNDGVLRGPALAAKRVVIRRSLHELAGKDLACWCPLDKPCHADVLLRLANQST